MKRGVIITIIGMFIIGLIGYLIINDVNPKRSFSDNGQLTQNQKLEDFEYMYTILKDNYPYFEVNKRQGGVDWLSRKDKYISEIKTTDNDDSFYKTLQNILSELNNGHTSLLSKDFFSNVKSAYEQDIRMNAAWLEQLDKPAAIKRYSAMQGSASESQRSTDYIVKENVKTNILEQDKAAYIAIHSFNHFNIDGDMKTIKPFLQSIKNYKSLIIDIRGNGGGDEGYWAKNIVPMLLNKPVKDTRYYAFRGGDFVEQFVKSRYGAGYGTLHKTSGFDYKHLVKLPPEIKQNFKYYDENIIPYEPANSIGYRGKIYLLVDSRVFSSSEAFAVFAKDTGFAVLVGERTGGDGIGFDPAVCALPNSGYIFRFPLVMGLTADGSSNFEYKTEPDIKVSAKIGTTLSDDEAIRAVLKLAD